MTAPANTAQHAMPHQATMAGDTNSKPAHNLSTSMQAAHGLAFTAQAASATTLRLSVPMFVWLLRRSAWVVGWVPLLISAGLLLWASYGWQQYTTTVAEQQRLTQLLQQPIASPRRNMPLAKTPPTPKPAEVDHASLLAAWQRLPVATDLPKRMRQIAHLAQRQQIALNIGDYQWQAMGNSDGRYPLHQFDMRLTLQTDYPHCKRFIASVLERVPDIALTSFELRKNETTQATIEATVTFTLLMRVEPHRGH